MMHIEWHTDLVADGTRKAAPEWPEDWPVPRVGDGVVNQEGERLTVTAVDWLPHGEDDSEPFVYVVLH
jgi:hypothetical protein